MSDIYKIFSILNSLIFKFSEDKYLSGIYFIILLFHF